jgi:DNA-binding MarR family transcriptional regulator
MGASGVGIQIEGLAQGLFDAITQFCLAVPRGRRRSGDLKEVEFLTLAILLHRDSMIVGDIQRLLGVLPAQMSRIIRSLESRDRPLITCRINPHDKRKIDVTLTPVGMKACQEYQSERVRGLTNLLSKLPDDDLEDVQRVLERLQDLIGPVGAS